MTGQFKHWHDEGETCSGKKVQEMKTLEVQDVVGDNTNAHNVDSPEELLYNDLELGFAQARADQKADAVVRKM